MTDNLANTQHPELAEIYRKCFSECSKSLSDVLSSDVERPANPLLISPPAGYYDSHFKVMYFGKETNGWGKGSFDESKGVDWLLNEYHDFVNHEGGPRYSGQFWNAIKKLQESFFHLHPSACFTYNNIVKIGKAKGKGLPAEELLKWQKSWFQVIREEVRLLAPNLILFLTGPNYDKFLQGAFGPIEFSQVGARTTRQLSRVRAQGLPVNTFRTYHPNYLWRHDFYSYQKDIIEASRGQP